MGKKYFSMSWFYCCNEPHLCESEGRPLQQPCDWESEKRGIKGPPEVILYTSCLYSIKSNCLIANNDWALVICKYHAKSMYNLMLSLQFSRWENWGSESFIKLSELGFKFRDSWIHKLILLHTTLYHLLQHLLKVSTVPKLVSRCHGQDQIKVGAPITISYFLLSFPLSAHLSSSCGAAAKQFNGNIMWATYVFYMFYEVY